MFLGPNSPLWRRWAFTQFVLQTCHSGGERTWEDSKSLTEKILEKFLLITKNNVYAAI